MALWQAQIRRPSFRGVSFQVNESELSTGRRAAVYQYPYTDFTDTDDLGQKSNSFTLQGFVWGETYFLQKKRLMDALNAEGSGELIHPYYGKLTVQVLDYSVSESPLRGGSAVFSMQFIEIKPSVTIPTTDGAEIKGFIDTAITAAVKTFSKVYSLANATTDAVTNALNIVDNATAAIGSIAQILFLPQQLANQVQGSIYNFKQATNAIITQPGTLARQLIATYATVPTAVVDLPSATQASAATTLNTTATDFGITMYPMPAQPVFDEPTAQQEQNRQALLNLTRFAAFMQVLSISAGATFASKQAADKAILAINRTNYTLNIFKDIPLYHSIQVAVRSTINGIMDGVATAGNETVLEVTTATPLVVLANTLGVTPESILANNKIPNPLFVKGRITYVKPN